MSTESERSHTSVLVPFLLGGLVGAVIGLLLAPKAGNEMRRHIKDLAVDTKDMMSSTLDKGIDLYDDARAALTSAVQAGKQAYLQERQKFQTLH